MQKKTFSIYSNGNFEYLLISGMLGRIVVSGVFAKKIIFLWIIDFYLCTTTMIIIQKYGEIDFYGIGKSRMKTMSQK